jgi:hypothetical protein
LFSKEWYLIVDGRMNLRSLGGDLPPYVVPERQFNAGVVSDVVQQVHGTFKWYVIVQFVVFVGNTVHAVLDFRNQFELYTRHTLSAKMACVAQLP